MNKILKIIIIPFLLIVSFLGCTESLKRESQEEKKKRQDKIIEEHLENGAWNCFIFSKKWQDNIDLGLEKDSTIAYLWQQKAMPYFKLRKYEIALPLINKAVKFDKNEWLPYRAFMKCIFVKTYREAIVDLEESKKLYGNRYIMDHTYDFYISLCRLQLNEFSEAEQILKKEINQVLQDKGEDWVHHTVLFYYGISKYEQDQADDAIEIFNRALNKYPNFSDAKYYKAICLMKLKRETEAEKLFKEAESDGKKGYTINEDNAIYEKYPYQVIWK